MASRDHATRPPGSATAPPAAAAPKLARSPAQVALNLQQIAGNRAATRALARFKAHPDPEHKEEMVPDSAWAGIMKFDPPKPK